MDPADPPHEVPLPASGTRRRRRRIGTRGRSAGGDGGRGSVPPPADRQAEPVADPGPATTGEPAGDARVPDDERRGGGPPDGGDHDGRDARGEGRSGGTGGPGDAGGPGGGRRGGRGTPGSGGSHLGLEAAMRARDVSRPTEAHLAAAERSVEIRGSSRESR